MTSTKKTTATCVYLGVDITDRYADSRRAMDVCGLEISGPVVERTFAWLNQFRRLRVRYEKRADILQAFVSLGCALICWQALRKCWVTD